MIFFLNVCQWYLSIVPSVGDICPECVVFIQCPECVVFIQCPKCGIYPVS